jgi:hypothetical protein
MKTRRLLIKERRGPRGLKRGEFLSVSLVAIIIHDPIPIEEDDEAIFFLLNSCVLEDNKVGEIGLFDSKFGGVLAKIDIDKDVSIILLLNPIRRPEGLKNFSLGGGTDIDFFFRIVSDLRAHIDPSDAAPTYQNGQEGY